jgi:recombination protein RecR
MLKNTLFESCVDNLTKLPGIGKKTAERLAMFLVKMKHTEMDSLINSIKNLNENIKHCKICGSLTENEMCNFCSDSSRDKSTICIVEKENDVFVIESTGRYNGLYHVLGGRISPLDGITPDELNINNLLIRINNQVREVIIATNADPDGETTAIYLVKILRKHHQTTITRIASGLPIGGFLEYSDGITVLKALENRRAL